MRKTIVTHEMIVELRRRYGAGETLYSITKDLHLDYERARAIIANGDPDAYAAEARIRQRAGQQKAGQESVRKRKARRLQDQKTPVPAPGFVFRNHKADARLVADQADHIAEMVRLKRLRLMSDFTPDELDQLEAKLRGWVATHAGLRPYESVQIM